MLRFLRVFKKIKLHYSKYGFLKTTVRALSAALFDYQTVCILEHDLHHDSALQIKKIPIDVKILRYEDAKNDANIRKQIHEQVDLYGLREEHLCSVAIMNKEIIAWLWMGFGAIFNHGSRKQEVLSTNECYIYNAITLPGYRGAGILSSILVYSNNYLKTRGFRRAFAATSLSNLAAIKAFEKSGFKRTKKLSYVKILLITFRKYNNISTEIF